MSAVGLRTARLRLDPVEPADVPALRAHWTAPEVRRYLWDGRSVAAEEVEGIVHTSERLFRELRYGLWALRPGAHSLPEALGPHTAAASAAPDRPSGASGVAEESGSSASRADVPLIGTAGFWFFHDPPERELMFSLSPAHWGRGLAQEAARRLIDYAFTRLGWDAVQASADAPNEPSLKLLRRLGMQPAGERPGFFGPILVYRIERGEWSEVHTFPRKR